MDSKGDIAAAAAAATTTTTTTTTETFTHMRSWLRFEN